MTQRHRTQFEKAPTGLTWDNLISKIVINYKPLKKGIHEFVLIVKRQTNGKGRRALAGSRMSRLTGEYASTRIKSRHFANIKERFNYARIIN